MEISKDRKKLTITNSELESKIRNKKGLQYILKQGC